MKKDITIQIGDKDEDTINISLSKLDMETLGLDKFMADFEDIGITMNGAGISRAGSLATSQFDDAGAKGANGDKFAAEKLGLTAADPEYTLSTADIGTIKNAADKVGTPTDVYTYDDGNTVRFFVEGSTGVQEVNVTFKNDNGVTKIDGTPQPEANALNALDADVLVNGKNELTNAQLKDKDLTDKTGTAITLDATQLDTLSNSLFGGDVAASGMKIFSVTGGATADTYYAIDNTGAVKSFTLESDGSATAGSIKVARAAEAEYITEVAAGAGAGGDPLKSATLLEEGGSLTAKDGSTVDLTKAKLDEISVAAFGAGQDAEASGMQLFSATTDSGETKYFAVGKDDKGNEVVKELTFADNATAPTASDASAADADFIKKEATMSGLLSKLDAALTTVADFRADLGAVQNRFSSIIANLNTNIINTTEAKSRIMDADFSVEVSAMSRANILQQAGVSVLAQANQVPQNVLSLLR